MKKIGKKITQGLSDAGKTVGSGVDKTHRKALELKENADQIAKKHPVKVELAKLALAVALPKALPLHIYSRYLQAKSLKGVVDAVNKNKKAAMEKEGTEPKAEQSAKPKHKTPKINFLKR